MIIPNVEEDVGKQKSKPCRQSKSQYPHLVKVEMGIPVDMVIPLLGTDPRLLILNTGCTTGTKSEVGPRCLHFFLKLPRWLFENLWPGEAPTPVHVDMCIRLSGAVLRIIVRNWKQPRCPQLVCGRLTQPTAAEMNAYVLTHINLKTTMTNKF